MMVSFVQAKRRTGSQDGLGRTSPPDFFLWYASRKENLTAVIGKFPS
jgi:hypothetical protein